VYNLFDTRYGTRGPKWFGVQFDWTPDWV
jgi:hypothetical protein